MHCQFYRTRKLAHFCDYVYKIVFNLETLCKSCRIRYPEISSHTYFFHMISGTLHIQNSKSLFYLAKMPNQDLGTKTHFPCASVFSLWVTQRYYINKIARLQMAENLLEVPAEQKPDCIFRMFILDQVNHLGIALPPENFFATWCWGNMNKQAASNAVMYGIYRFNVR